MQEIDEIVPTLLHALENDQMSYTALDGLKQILSVRTIAVMPKLVQLPLSAFNAHALGALEEVAGPGLDSHLSIVLPALLAAMGNSDLIVGHSLGGGTAALLTYIFREQKEFSSTTCITFAPAACLTLELAESGKHFITTIINGSDLVPTFSTASIDNLRSEVTASSWCNDLLDQVEHTRVLNVVYRSATALGSRLPSIASARERVAGASALLRPVSSSTQVVMKHAQNVAQAVVKTRSTISSWIV